MKLGDAVAVKTSRWVANEILHDDDINFISQAQYQNITDLFALLSEQRLATGTTKDLVVAGLLLEHNNLLTCQLRVGSAVSYSGSYFDEDGVWGFVVLPGDVFSALIPQDTVVAFNSGSTSDRIDTLEIRPTRVSYNAEERAFKDPITGQVTTSNTNTRYKYDSEFQILKGTEGAGVAPTHTSGWIKVAEVTVPAGASFLVQGNIKDVRNSDTWTTEVEATKYKSIVYAATVSIDDINSRYTATETESALQEIAGSGRTNETVKGNAGDLSAHVSNNITDVNTVHGIKQGSGNLFDADLLDSHEATYFSVAGHNHNDIYYTETELNNGQLDNRYFTETEHLNISAGVADAGKPIKLDAAGHIDATMINDADVSHANLTGTHNLTTDIDHDTISGFVVGEHRTINDVGTLTTELFSASKIISDLGGKSDTTHNHDAAYLGLTAKAANSELLDNIDSGSFLRSDIDDDVSAHTTWQDGKQIRLGTDGKFVMFFQENTTNFYSCHHGGNLYFVGEDAGGVYRVLMNLMPNGANTFYYIGNKKLETTSTGAKVTGSLEVTENINLKDSKYIYLGTDNDFGMIFPGANTYFKSFKHGGHILFQGENSSGVLKDIIQMNPDGEISLYYAGVSKVVTKTTGAYINGYLQLTETTLAPLIVASTTKVANLNADLLDGADLSTATGLGTSNVLVPSQNAVKVYADTKLAISDKRTCKAWANFNGIGTVAIRDSINVSSITDLGVGYYRVNFINVMNDTNYAPKVSGLLTGSIPLTSVQSLTVNNFVVRSHTMASAALDAEMFCSVFGS